MPNYTDADLKRISSFGNTEYDSLPVMADDLIAARARIAELEAQVTELRKAVANTEQRVLDW